MTITRNFKLCLNAGTQNAPYINANQYDEGEEWVFDLYTEGGQKFTPSTGAIIGIKSDGHAILNSGTVNSDGQVVITETQQMTAASGLAVFELLIEGETHGTANFIVNVERRPSDDAEFSDSDLSMLQEAIDSAAEIEDLLDGETVDEKLLPIVQAETSDWLTDHITNPSNPPIDTSLSVAGAAADSKKVGDELSDLKNAFEEYEDGEYQYLKGTFQQGGLNSGNLQPSQKYRVSETDIISYDRDITLIIGSGYRVCVHVFVNGVFSSDSGWQTGSYRIPANTTFKLVIAKISEDTSSTADIVIFKSAIKFQSVININTESIRSISEVSTKNLSPRSEAVTTSTGYLNGSTGTFGTVESGKTYTFSAFNESDKTYGVTIRINDGGWKQQAVFNPLANARFSVTFTATVDGDISLSTAYGSYYDPLFSQIQLEEGSTATEYVPYHDTSAVDKVARKAINDFYKFNSDVRSVAHQGCNIFGYPQNTLPNFIACAKNGWKEVEFDVQWTSDNVPVISHDDTKTIYGTSTTVSIASTTYSDLQNMQFFADATIKIPSLYDALDICKLYGLNPHVELKTNATTAQITTIINYLKRKKLFANAFITSFQLGSLITAISIDNNLNVLLNVSSTDSIDDLIASDSHVTTLLNHAGKTTFAFSYTLLAGLADAKTHLAEFSDKGAYICVYTLDTEALINTYAPMCDYITSNAFRVEEVIA